MENVNWGVPTLRKRKEEKYSTPVVAMNSLSIKGAGRKFSFNKAAQEAMGMDSEKGQSILVGFDDENQVYFKVIDGESASGYKLTQTGTFSNKKVYEFIAKNLELDTEVENEFSVVSLPDGTFKMESFQSEEKAQLPESENTNTDSIEEAEVLEDKEAEEAVSEDTETEVTEEW